MRTTALMAALCIGTLTLYGCSSKHSSTNASTPDAAAGDDDDDDGGSQAVPTVKDNGTITSYDDNGKTPLRGATVTLGSTTTTTDDKGTFAIDVPVGQPFGAVITLPTYTTTYMPEQIALADYTRRPILVPSTSTFHLAQGALPGFDVSKGVVSLVLYALPPCTSIAGGTVTINSPSDAKLVYFRGALTSTSQTEFQDHIPAAALYNVPPGQQVDLTIHHPTCKAKAFPVTLDNATYTGKTEVHASSEDANSVLILFLE